MDTSHVVRRYTLTGQVEEALKREITSGQLVPGQALRTNEIAERYRVSATPTREALQRLSAQGLVVADEKRVLRVADVSVEEMDDIYWVRLLLEPAALRRSFENATPAWKQSIDREMHELRDLGSGDARFDSVRWSLAHRRFHFAFFTAAKSPQLVRILEHLYNQSERYRVLVRELLFPSAATHDDHEDMAAAILADRPDDAVEALTRHLRSTVRLLRAAGLPPTGATLRPPGEGGAELRSAEWLRMLSPEAD